MKIINPFGKSNNESQAKPNACMCHGSAAFQSARGSDGCFVCGCHCGSDPTVTKGNSSSARWTIRRSAL